MTSITVLYGTTSANQAIPVLVDDAGQVVIDGGGTPGDSYWTLDGDDITTIYSLRADNASWKLGLGGLFSCTNISLKEGGQTQNAYWSSNGNLYLGNGGALVPTDSPSTGISLLAGGFMRLAGQTASSGGSVVDNSAFFQYYLEGERTFNLTADGTVYCKKVVDGDGYDLSKIGTALSTIHDVVESVDDLQGLKNLLKLVLDNLKDDIIPPPE